MKTALLLIPSGGHLMWGPPEDVPPQELALRVERGQWSPRPAWLARLQEAFAAPRGGVTWHAAALSGLVVIYPTPALVRRCPPRRQPLSADQRRVLYLLAAGFSTRAAAHRLGRGHRWALYQAAEVRRFFCSRRRARCAGRAR
jgi:hypothetical protein